MRRGSTCLALLRLLARAAPALHRLARCAYVADRSPHRAGPGLPPALQALAELEQQAAAQCELVQALMADTAQQQPQRVERHNAPAGRAPASIDDGAAHMARCSIPRCHRCAYERRLEQRRWELLQVPAAGKQAQVQVHQVPTRHAAVPWTAAGAQYWQAASAALLAAQLDRPQHGGLGVEVEVHVARPAAAAAAPAVPLHLPPQQPSQQAAPSPAHQYAAQLQQQLRLGWGL